MKKKAFFSILAILSITVLLLTGCGGNGKSTKENDPLADGVLKLGTNDTYVPLEYRDENNKTVGFDIDLGNALAEELGVKAEWVSTAWDGIFNGLNASQYDAIISGTSITPERQKGFSMSKAYLTNGIVIVSRKGGVDGISGKDLEGKRVGVQIETTADYAAEVLKTKDGINFEIKKFDAMLDAFAALEGKTIDFILTDLPVGQFYTKLKPDVYYVSSEVLSNEPIGITMRKGDVDFAKKVDAALDKMREKGKLTELSIKWLGTDETKDIDTNLKIIE